MNPTAPDVSGVALQPVAAVSPRVDRIASPPPRFSPPSPPILTLAAVEPSLEIGENLDLPGETLVSNLQSIKRLETDAPEPAVALPPPPPPPASESDEQRSSEQLTDRPMEPARLLTRVMPVYPELARKARIEGVVTLDATITESGSLDNVTVVSGHPMLIENAVNAVRQWHYQPAKLHGVPTRSSVTIRVNFKLQYQ